MNIFEIFNTDKSENINIAIHNNELYTAKEIRSLILPLYKELAANKCKKILITSNNHFDFFIKFLASIIAGKELYFLPDLRRIELLDFEYLHLNKTDFSNIKKSDIRLSNEKPKGNVDFDKTLLHLYTSGSTGTPKCVTKTLKNLAIEASDIFEEYKDIIKDKTTSVVTSTTPHHMFCMSFYILFSVCYPGKILFDSREILYPDDCDLNDKIFISTPSFLEKFKKYEIDLPNPPRLIMTAGDKLNDEVFTYFYKKKIPLREIYGSSEVGVVAYKTEPYQEVFHCYKNIEIETDKDSRILVHSPFYTGDNYVLGDFIELLDKKNFILKNRSDRILKIQEKRISAVEIENFAKESEYIQDAYCFKYGEKLACAAVLTDKGKEICLDSHTKLTKQIKSLIKQKSEIIPQKWRYLYEIPKTKTGKIDLGKIKHFFDINLSLPLVLDKKCSADEISYKLVFTENCNFFEGHFEKFPILPGVVQFYFAHMFAQYEFDIKISETPVKKMKFSHIIKPGEQIELHLQKTEKNIIYEYKYKDKTCSGGVFQIE